MNEFNSENKESIQEQLKNLSFQEIILVFEKLLNNEDNFLSEEEATKLRLLFQKNNKKLN